MNTLEEQLCAARGFSVWLSEQSTSDTNASMLSVLEKYGLELQRQIDGIPVEQELLAILFLASTEAALLRDELTDANPALMDYRPADEPQDIDEMAIRLLSDAIKLFDETVDGRVYLEIPGVAVEIDRFVNKVLTAQETK